jgi:hypothetical protein
MINTTLVAHLLNRKAQQKDEGSESERKEEQA